MIRINLLPVKKDRRRETARNQILIGVLALAVEIAICAVLYMGVTNKVDAKRNLNQLEQAEVDSLKKEVAKHPQILSRIKDLEKKEEAINKLLAARTGPVYVMLELSNIISKGGRPHLDHDKYQELIRKDPASGFDESWDFRRIWIESFEEKSRVVTLEGQALTHEDVAEFLRRINLSDFFVSSELISTELALPSIKREGFNKDKTEPVVHFKISATVRYR